MRRLSMRRVDDSEIMKWGPAEALLVYDVIFFANYALGWVLTYIYNETGIDDNNVTRIYKVYNICIGVDTFPARPVCCIFYTISMLFFALSCYMHWIKIYFDGGMPLWVATIWLTVACGLSLLFTLTFHVPPSGGPDDVVQNTFIHVMAFAGGMTGYCMLKIFGAYKYYSLGLYGKQEWQGHVYFYSFVVQAFVFAITVVVLGNSLLDPKLGDMIAMAHPPEHIGIDWSGSALVLVAFLGPIIQYNFVPDELRNTAHIIDATQGEGFLEGQGRGVMKRVMVDDNEMLKWGPAEALVLHDFIFFGNYLVGWILTWMYNPKAIVDNNVTRIYKVYNVCIGVDTSPARPICSVIYTVSMLFFAWSCYMHWIKVYFDGGMPLAVATIWLGSSLALALTFTLTFAVPPSGEPDVVERNVLIHVLAFAGGMLGYTLLKIFGAYKYYALGMYGKHGSAGRVYFMSFVVQAVIFFLSVIVLIQSLMAPELPEMIAAPHPPEHIAFDFGGMALVAVAAFGPMIQWYLVPAELRNTAHIIDATQELTDMGGYQAAMD